MTIRPCREADMAAIAEIYAHHVLHGTASFEIVPPSHDEMQRRLRDILDRSLPYIVTETDGEIIGYAYAGIYRPRAAYRDTVENSVYIRHDLTGRGIGKLLLESLIRECEACDLRQMIAVIGDSAHTVSIRLHERCGFRLIGLLSSVGYKHGRWLDSVLMQRTLGTGDTTPPSIREA